MKRLTPIMGWASWNCFRTNISEEAIKLQADALVQTGLSECGYTYLNMDDGFQGGRDKSGKILFHKKRFPNGIKTIADYAHSLGLKAGIYADAGDNTCGYVYDSEGENGKYVGLYGYEEQDLQMYLSEYGFDFIKVDWCGGIRMDLDEETQYKKIGYIIEKIRQQEKRNIVYNVCRWQFPGEWVISVADSWRTAADIRPEFSSIMQQLDNVKALRKYCGPGHVNDLDMMQLGNGMSHVEEKTHFSMWCMMSTPLIIGCDLTKIDPMTLHILKNTEMISVNQDIACQQAFVAKEIRSNDKKELLCEIWVKDLEKINSNKKAVAVLNRSEQTITLSFTPNEIGLSAPYLKIRDLWKHEDITPKAMLSTKIEPHGVEVFVIEGKVATEIRDIYCSSVSTQTNCKIEEIQYERVNDLISNGAILVDVRTKEEYDKNHEFSSINLPYTDIHGTAYLCLPDKDVPVIVCCKTGKRCSQAGQSLKYLGYKTVYKWKMG